MIKTMIIFITAIFLIPVISSSPGDQKIHKIIQGHTDEIFESIVKIRRDIHQYPELAGGEKRTSDRVAKHLKSLGLEVTTHIGGHGVLGILKGDHPGPVIGWRADMDALAWNGKENSEYASRIEGVRHICGHDVHTSIALGIAEVLSSIKDKLNGSVVFIFQPSEENFQGARAMIHDGLFEKIKPDLLFALHMAPLPYNQVAVKPEEMFAYRGVALKLKLKKSAQAETKQEEIIEYIKKLSTISPQDMMNVPLFNEDGGILSPDCIIRDYFVVNDRTIKTEKTDGAVVIQAEVYSSSLKRISSTINKIKTSEWENWIDEVTYSAQLWQKPVINDPIHTKRATDIIASIYGKESVLPLYGVTPMFNDDFAQFQEKIPGVYFFLGGSNFDKGIISMPHSPNFSVDEECIRTGINYFSSLIFANMATN